MRAKTILLSLIKRATLQDSAVLQPQQERVIERIKQPGTPGLIVYHGLGSGKSLSSIAAGDALGGNTQVIVPASLRTNYAKELNKFVAGDPSNFKVRSYQDAVTHGLQDADLTVFDEAHRTGREALHEAAVDGFMHIEARITAESFDPLMIVTSCWINNSPLTYI